MEYIDPEYKVREADELLNDNMILTDLESYGADTSFYDIKLIDNITSKDLFILTSDGKAFKGSSIKCKKTKQKDKIHSGTIELNVNDDRGFFQFIAIFPDGTKIDARGYYAKNSLKIVQKRKGIR